MKGLRTESGDKTRLFVTPLNMNRIRNLSVPKHSVIPVYSISTRPTAPRIKLRYTLPDQSGLTTRDQVRHCIEKIERFDFGVCAKKFARSEAPARSEVPARKNTQNVIRLFRDRLRVQWRLPNDEANASHLEMIVQKQALVGRPPPKRSTMTAYHPTRLLPQAASPRCFLRKRSTLLAAWGDD